MASFVVLFAFIIYVDVVSHAVALNSIPTRQYTMNINMPDVSAHARDSYICTAKKLDPAESYIIQYEPDADSSKAHHMLLFGCSGLQSQSYLYPGSWKCGSGELCHGMTIIYGWANNAPSMSLPPNVGHLVGGNSSIQYLVLQLHYASAFQKGVTDNSGLKLHMTTEKQPYITGIYLLMAMNAYIPPYKPRFHVDINCKFPGTAPIHLFAYRVHAHRLGSVVSGYKYSVQNNSWSFLAKGNPQWPQAFYPMEQTHTVTSHDILAMRCTYNTTRTSSPTYIGSTSTDEMCNLYLMYFTEYRNMQLEQIHSCTEVEFTGLIAELPPGNDEPLPENLALEKQAHAVTFGDGVNSDSSADHLDATLPQDTGDGSLHAKRILSGNNLQAPENSSPKYRVLVKWPSPDLQFGQVSAVAIDKFNNIVVFHRGSHVWNDQTFDYFHRYKLPREEPISIPTILTIDSVSGHLLHHWGINLFFIPHGLSVDHHGRYWVTDVALHQVFCFPVSGKDKPLLIIGERFVPGNDQHHFCKPTSAAVNVDGEIFVADGYCNARVIKFSPNGRYITHWGERSVPFDRHPTPGTFNLPHKIVLLEDRNMFCVADRENKRIQCFKNNGDFVFEIQREEFGDTLFSIAYAEKSGLLFGVSGEALNKDYAVKAFVFNITNQQLLTSFAPKSGTFSRPHDITVSADGEVVYVCEIGPNTVWKFLKEIHKSTKKVLNTDIALSSSSGDQILTNIPPMKQSHKVDQPLNSNDIEDEMKNFETSVVIMALLGIPILLLILITAIIRLRKRGKLQGVSFGHLKGWMGGYKTPHPQEKFNLGQFLNPHKGFDRVAVVESDGDEEGEESENEEFCATAKNA